MFFKAFGRRIEFPEIFCTFSKISLAEGGGPVAEGGSHWRWMMVRGPAAEGGGPIVVEGNWHYVVMSDNRGNFVFLQEKIFPSYGNITIPCVQWKCFDGNIDLKLIL